MYKKIFTIFFLLTSIIQASLVNTAFVQHDVRILNELDIDTKYITDYKLQKAYKKLLSQTKDDYTKKLNDAHLFVPKIKKILKQNNIPSAFMYLVMAESNFVLTAKSNKKAMGLWQFMSVTAKRYGLQHNDCIDERMDVIKSTEAAAKYLNYLYKKFGKWYIAAIAYNCGEGRIIEGITRATLDLHCEKNNNCRKDKTIQRYRKTIRAYQKKQVKFIELYKIYNIVKKWKYKLKIEHILIEQKGISRQYIPKESREYIRKIIALAMMNNSEFLINDDNSNLLNRGICDPISTVKVEAGTSLKTISDIIGISKKRLQNLNQHIKQNKIPKERKHYSIYIPYSTLARFNTNKHNIKPTSLEIYKVKAGDSLISIAKKYKIKYKIIQKFNKLKSSMLTINQELVIPITSTLAKITKIYIVKQGDNLHKISQLYKIKISQLMQDNKLKTSMIKIGDKLVVKYY